MPGIPKTQRCERCRRRKIKCDENWPTCTSCKRSDAICSGPLVGCKFVYSNGQSATHVHPPPESASQAPSSSNGSALVSVHSRSPMSPRPYPTTASDRVAGGLVIHLEQSPELIREFLLAVGFFRLLPARLGASPALRDCVALFMSSWANFRRGLSCEEATHPALYGKALRSLRGALVSSQPATCENLAAVSVLERFETMFDIGRPLNSSSHRSGIITLMAHRGPPRLDNELDVLLALDNYLNLCCHWLVRGGDSLFEAAAWKGVLQRAIDNLPTDSDMRKNAYRLELFMGDWVSLVRDLRPILNDPSADSRRTRARALQDRVTNRAAELDLLGGSTIEFARSQGRIVELPDPGCPIGVKYGFSGLDEHRCLVIYAMLRIVFNRILWKVNDILDGPAAAILDMEHAGFCRQVWMSLPYAREVSLMVAILFADPLYLSYEGARGETQEYLLTSIVEITRYRQRLPNDRHLIHGYLLDTARAMTGRIAFRERADFPYWKKRPEAVMQST